MRSLVAIILFITIVTFTSGAIAGGWGYFAKENELLYGTWVNSAYGVSLPQKIIYQPTGIFECFKIAGSEKCDKKGRYLITGKWMDSEGNIIYRSHWVGDWTEEAYQLSKISDTGKTIEIVLGYHTPPTKVDSNNVWYRKYTRK